MGDAVGDQQQKHVAMKRVGLPHELSNLILFLGSDESSFCTGQWVVYSVT